jgi:hypothetical protein
MLKTKHEIKMNFRGHDIVVPAGQSVSKCKDSTGQYFVENFASFIDERVHPMLFHDATYYGIRVDVNDVFGAKAFKVQERIGRARHVVSFHDGVKTHADYSPFFDMQICGNKRARQKFVKELTAAGYVEQ